MSIDLPEAGTVCMLTTYGPDGSLHTRPVKVWPGNCPYDLLVLTEYDAAKLTDIAHDPQVGLGAQSAEGWWSAEGTATVDPDATADTLRAAGLSSRLPVTVVRITLSRVRQWVVTGTGPWDNSYAEQTFPAEAP